MMCYKSKEDPLYEAARKHPIAAKRFMSWTEEAIRESILKERRIMGKEDDIESLIESTIAHVKIALDSNKPGEVKLYAAALVLLRQAQSISSVNWLPKKDKTYDKPFEKISEKHILDAPLTDRKQNG